jgi:hypothetical protein
VYGWIWRRLPFGPLGKSIGSVLLILAAAALLWYVVFPAVDPYLPFNDRGVTSPDGPPAPSTSAPPTPAPSATASTR